MTMRPRRELTLAICPARCHIRRKTKTNLWLTSQTNIPKTLLANSTSIISALTATCVVRRHLTISSAMRMGVTPSSPNSPPALTRKPGVRKPRKAVRWRPSATTAARAQTESFDNASRRFPACGSRLCGMVTIKRALRYPVLPGIGSRPVQARRPYSLSARRHTDWHGRVNSREPAANAAIRGPVAP
jgi:hypothetical protein